MVAKSGAFMSEQLTIRPLQALRALAQRHDTTLFVVFTLALQMVLSRHKKSGDVAFGAYTAQRVYADFTQTLGNFINPTIVTSHWHEDETFAQALAVHHQQISQDFAWQHIPYEYVMSILAPDLGDTSMPLFNVSLVFNDHVVQKEHRQEALHVKLESHAEHSIDFAFDTDIEFMAHTNAEGLFIAAAYRKHKVGGAFIQMVLNELLVVLSRFPNISPTTVMAQMTQDD